MSVFSNNTIRVASFFKGITLNKMRRLDHDSLKRPETRSFK